MFKKTKNTIKDLYKLTDKEIEVCQFILQGVTAAQLAASMNISHETVKSHLKNIFQKTNIRSQTELVRVLTQLASVTTILQFKATGKKQTNLILKQDYISLPSEVCKTRYGTNLYYSLCGDPKGRPVIFFHSPYDNHCHWQNTALAAKNMVLNCIILTVPAMAILSMCRITVQSRWRPVRMIYCAITGMTALISLPRSMEDVLPLTPIHYGQPYWKHLSVLSLCAKRGA